MRDKDNAAADNILNCRLQEPVILRHLVELERMPEGARGKQIFTTFHQLY